MWKDQISDVFRNPNILENALASSEAITFLDAGDRVYKFRTSIIENVCADEHIRAYAEVDLSPRPLQTIELELVVEWSLLFEQRFPLERDEITSQAGDFTGYSGDDGVGPKVFRDEPAWYEPSTDGKRQPGDLLAYQLSSYRPNKARFAR